MDGRLRPQPKRIKVRIDARQLGIRRFLQLRVPRRGESDGIRLGSAWYVDDGINVEGRGRNKEEGVDGGREGKKRRQQGEGEMGVNLCETQG